MKRTRLLVPIFILLTLAIVACTPPPVAAPPDANLTVSDVWARQSPMDGGNSAVYMVIQGGNAADALVGVSTDVSEVVEMHETIMDNDVMRMQPVAGQRIDIPANGMVEFKPGGLHIMLINLKQPLMPGENFDLTLDFEQAGQRVVSVEVREVEGMNMGGTEGDAMNHAN